MESTNETDDPFIEHFHKDLSEEMVATLNNSQHFDLGSKSLPTLGKLKVKLVKFNANPDSSLLPVLNCSRIYANPSAFPNIINKPDWCRFHVKSQIRSNLSDYLSKHFTYNNNREAVNDFLFELLSLIYEYKDLYFTEQTIKNREQIRFVYCLHAINHVLKTRLKVIHHNARLNDKKTDDVPDEFRDQGLVRPKVLFLVPFRNSALKIVKMLISILLSNEKDNVENKKRFFDEFTGSEVSVSQKRSRPEDFGNIFDGNVDDNFKVGIAVTKKSLKLYADFYSSDIIVASPLGLRMLIGAKGESNQDYDFLASIEVLIIDQTDIFLMQNWDHLLHIMDHLHLQPKESHGTNFARVRLWSINGWAKYYRQTLIFTGHPLSEISALFKRRCHNYAGSICTANPITAGTICQVVVHIPQVFYRLKDATAIEIIDERFNFFTKNILPQYQDNSLGHTLIYVPSYFDFVRLRNYFMTEMISFVQISEYTKDGKVAEARYKFFHREANFLLYSERFHFYNRRKIRGIKHLVFYQLPSFPNFYSEMCNLMQILNQNKRRSSDDCNMTIVAIYSKFDAAQLSSVVTSERAGRLLSSDKSIHMFNTDDK